MCASMNLNVMEINIMLIFKRCDDECVLCNPEFLVQNSKAHKNRQTIIIETEQQAQNKIAKIASARKIS